MLRLARSPCLLLLLLLLNNCSQQLTGPSFELAGTWTGTFTDPLITAPGGVPFVGTITLTIEPDGLGTGTARANYTLGSAQMNTRLTLDLIVYPDGAVTGSGEYLFSATGYYPLRGFGEVIGQLEIDRGKGYGVLAVVMVHNDLPAHVPWSVSRSK